MSTALDAYIQQQQPLIDRALRARLPISKLGGSATLNEAVAYAVLSGGKRMRPILALLAAEACGASAESALGVGCAVEFLHAASLALDDLPAMDDAGLRRGRASVHALYGQGVAILAALALLNESYAIFAGYPELLPRAVREIGVDGMVGGQAVDIYGSSARSRFEKTTALTRLSMAAGAAAAGASPADAHVLIAFGHSLGEAYQICDDVADAFSSDAELGKTTQQDRRHGRGSAVEEFGEVQASEHAAGLVRNACENLRGRFEGYAAELLQDFAYSVVERCFAVVK
jgi:geranylgeranyl pyrophosphate synthase